MKSILLTNAQLRKTLAVVRSLGSKHIPVYVTETTRCNPAAFSKYCAGQIVGPDPNQSAEIYATWLAETVSSKAIQVLFPMDDNTMNAVMEHAHLFDNVLTALPPLTSYRNAADKGQAVKYAIEAGTPVPSTFLPTQLNQIEEFGKKLSEPMVIKPRHSSGSRGIRIVHDRNRLVEEYRAIHGQYHFPLLQEFIPSGERYDVCLLYDLAGQLRASFVQKELRHFPVKYGPSTVQESVYRPDLIEMAVSIMSQLPWRGIVELEFMIDPRDGLPKFMEINPRFWNSLYTAVLAGIDFPWLLYQIACGETVENHFSYKAGVRCRNLLPGDMLHYIANPRRFQLEPGFWSGSAKGGSDDIISMHDPMPSVGFLLSCLRYVPDPKAWKMLFNRS